MNQKKSKRRVWILLILIVLCTIGAIAYKSYICTALLGAFTTLLAFSTVGEVLYRKALQRQAKIEALNNQRNEDQHPD